MNIGGFATDNKIFIAREYGTFTTVNDRDTESITLSHCRNLSLTFFLIIVFIAQIYISLFILKVNATTALLKLAASVPLLAGSIFNKKHELKVIIVTKSLGLITDDINSNSKNVAGKIISELHYKIKKIDMFRRQLYDFKNIQNLPILIRLS